MSKEAIEKWFNSLPKIERQSDEPLIISEGKAYSAKAVLAEVKAGSELGMKLQSVIESKRYSTAEDKYALALARLRERLPKLPKEFRIVVGMKIYSPSEMLHEINTGTSVGRTFIEAEIRRTESILT